MSTTTTRNATTPGPWEVRGIWIFPNGKDDDVAHVTQSYLRSRTERAANARLIAAAPELREALRAAQGELQRLREAMQYDEGTDTYHGPMIVAASPLDYAEEAARAALAKADGKEG